MKKLLLLCVIFILFAGTGTPGIRIKVESSQEPDIMHLDSLNCKLENLQSATEKLNKILQ